MMMAMAMVMMMMMISISQRYHSSFIINLMSVCYFYIFLKYFSMEARIFGVAACLYAWFWP